MTKAEWRSRLKTRRDAYAAALSVGERAQAADALATRVLGQVSPAASVALYLPIGSEIDTGPLIERLHAAGKILALPHVTGRASAMRFLRWAPGDALVPGPLGLRQPAAEAPELTPDVVVTPLLGFDAALNRLGYGAGHYDRAFAALPAAQRIGVAWAVQRVALLPTEPTDLPLHAVATDTDWITR